MVRLVCPVQLLTIPVAVISVSHEASVLLFIHHAGPRPSCKVFILQLISKAVCVCVYVCMCEGVYTYACCACVCAYIDVYSMHVNV